MKKLVKPFKNENELQTVNALCAEFAGCGGYTCGTYDDPSCGGLPTCNGYAEDEEIGDDIIF